MTSIPHFLREPLTHVVVALSLMGCVKPIELEAPADETAMDVGESRTVELRMLRLTVDGYEQEVDMDTLRALPRAAVEDVWMLDLELTPLVTNTLSQLRDLEYDEAQALPLPAQNMRTLLRTTPDNVSLEDTALEELVALSAALGIPPARALSDLLEVGITEPIIDIDVAADSVVQGLIASHPSSQVRQGPITADNPTGTYPVAENSLPITIGDLLDGFSDLPEKFGPVETEFGMHPGFIEEATGLTVTEDDFSMTVKVNGNALPFKGIDLSNGAVGSVNAIGSQIDTLFPLDDPDWMTIQGLVPEPTIETMTVYINEDDRFFPGGDSREPAPYGNSEAWDLAPWVFERMVAQMTYDLKKDVTAHAVEYSLGTGTTAFRAEVDDTGWSTFYTFNGVGNPPAPAYLWDLMMELGQVRIHDGGIPEGEGNVQFTLKDLPMGVSADELVAQIKTNMAANPASLRGLASALVDTSDGEPDLFYVRPEPTDPEAQDWLYFLLPEDIPSADDGPARTYDYAQPGFYADASLSTKVSTTVLANGDDTHEKVQIADGDVLYVQDNLGAVYRLDILDKPSTHRVAVEITREQ